jgi:hypothetical protein
MGLVIMVKVSIKTKNDFTARLRNTHVLDTTYRFICEKHGEFKKALWIGSLGADLCVKCLKEAIEQET